LRKLKTFAGDIMMDSFYIDIHTHCHAAVSHDILRVVNLFAGEKIPGNDSNTFYSAGLHPWHINAENVDFLLQDVEKILQHPTVIAVGETGLDKLTEAPMELQKEIFLHHLFLAEKFAKPVFIHSVRSHFELINVYKKSGVKVPLIFHGFNGNAETAQQLLKLNCYFSFGIDLLKEKTKIIETFKNLPAGSLFLETDNSNTSIIEIYEKAAFLRHNSMDDLKHQIYQNFKKVFREI
jgi:TatD DNase family protein